MVAGLPAALQRSSACGAPKASGQHAGPVTPIDESMGQMAWKHISTVALVACLAAVTCFGSAIDASLSSVSTMADAIGTGLVDRLNQYLAALALAHNFSGAAVLAEGDSVMLSRGYGWADWSRQVPTTAHTPYPIGAYTIAPEAVLQLEDAGKLHRGDHVCRYIPHCPGKWTQITLAELLDGTSG